MSEADRKLAQACSTLSTAAGEAIAWFADNPDKVAQERASLDREFRKISVTARKLATAAERPMCVGVFGPSQVGKSYLISALARSGTDPLIVEFEGIEDGFDFVRDINPEGGEESTGLVTRFTLQHQPAPAGFPVVLRLLSETDIVKILANTYLSDLDRSDEATVPIEDIQQAFERARSAAQAKPVDRLTIDDVYDLREYFEKYFKAEFALSGSLASSYWPELERLAPLLPVSERARLFSFLWGRHEPFTRIYLDLYAALASLDFAEEAYAEMDALSPGTRVDSIIDVRTLFKLGDGTDGAVSVRGNGGKEAVISRAKLAALVAELRIVIKRKPWEFFDHTDLLDFPGARSRENDPPERIFAKPDGVANLFLRGKVAYLYERYCAELELTSMLLCVAPSNQEVRSLPKMVNDWIEATHGATPQARAAQETALFVVLTKFDLQFEEKAGEGPPAQRFTTRMNVNLTEFFGRTHDWPHEWQPGRPFTNCYWMRNPGFRAKNLIRYDASGIERGLLESETARIAEFKSAYLANDLVRRHFADPEKAWDAAFKLNDGGITYLAASLAPVCNPEIKHRQVKARFEEQRALALETLSRFHTSDDVEEEKTKRRAQAIETLKQLETSVEDGKFGHLLARLGVSERALADLYFRIANDTGEDESEAGERRSRGSGASHGLLLEVLGDDGSGGAPAKPAPDAGPHDRAAIYAEEVVASWIEEMRSVSESQQSAGFLRLTPPALNNIVSELAEGERRLGIRQHIARQVRSMNEYRQTPKQAMAKSAMVAAIALNGFINDLGFSSLPEGQRPHVGRYEEDRRPIFLTRPAIDDLPPLADTATRTDRLHAIDWMAAYIRLVEDNVLGRGGDQPDEAENIRLGTLIGRIHETGHVT